MSQVTDYNIANASGASVRADINLVLDAIKTCNAGVVIQQIQKLLCFMQILEIQIIKNKKFIKWWFYRYWIC